MLGLPQGLEADPVSLATGNPVKTGPPERVTMVALLTQVGSSSLPLL